MITLTAIREHPGTSWGILLPLLVWIAGLSNENYSGFDSVIFATICAAVVGILCWTCILWSSSDNPTAR